MPSYHCPGCQTTLSVGAVPEEKLAFLIPDRKLNLMVKKILESLTESSEDSDANIGFQIETNSTEVYRCSECGTLVITGETYFSGVYQPVKELA